MKYIGWRRPAKNTGLRYLFSFSCCDGSAVMGGSLENLSCALKLVMAGKRISCKAGIISDNEQSPR
jgi:hypothetical protein